MRGQNSNMARQLPIRNALAQQRVKDLRLGQAPAEQLVWSLLRNRQLAGLKFRRQFPIGPFIADFYCHEAKLVVELDGESHDGRAQVDADRTRYLEAHELHVFRVANADVYADLEAVAHGIMKAAGIDVEKWLVERSERVIDRKPPSP